MRVDVVSASAGTGKTYRLTEELVRALRAREVEPERVVAITYTTRAAGELESRIRERLLEEGEPLLAARVRDGHLGTIHAVCQRLLGELALEAGLSPFLEPIPESQRRRLFAESLSRVLAGRGADLDRTARRLGIEDWQGIARGIVDAARANGLGREGLDRSREESLRTLRALLPPPAISRDGYRERFEREIARVHPALDAASLEDGTKAARNRAWRAGKLLEAIRAGELPPWPEQVGALGELGLASLEPVAGGLLGLVERHLAAEELQSDLVEMVDRVFGVAADALEAFDDAKRRARVVDFGDMLAHAADLLRRPALRDALAARVGLVLVDEFQDTSPMQLAVVLGLAALAGRSLWVGDRKQAIFSFQGSDPDLMDRAREHVSGDREPTFLEVSWRSRPDLVALTSELFARALAPHGFVEREVRLGARPDLEALAGQPVLEAWPWAPGRRDGAKASEPAAAAAGVASLLASGLLVRERSPSGEADRTRPVKRRDVAVIARTNVQCEKVAAALRDLGVPAVVALRGLVSTPEARLARAALALVADGSDGVAAMEVSYLAGGASADPDAWLASRLLEVRAAREARDAAGARGDPPTPSPLPFSRDPRVAALAALRARADDLSPAEALDAATGAIDLATLCRSWPEPGRRLANLEALRGEARAYEELCRVRRSAGTVPGLVEHLGALAEEEEEDSNRQAVPVDEDAVVVSTWHAAKGLEWPVVVLSHLDESRPPMLFRPTVEPAAEFDAADPLRGRWIRYWPWPYGGKRSKDVALLELAERSAQGRRVAEADRRERLRLLYVGFTRARDVLALVGRVDPSGPALAALDVLAGADGAPLLALPWDDPGPLASASAGTVSARCRVRRVSGLPAPVAPPPEAPRPWYDAGERPGRPREVLNPSSEPPRPGPAPAIAAVTPLAGRVPVSAAPDAMGPLGDAVHAFLAADAGGDGAARRAMAERLLAGHGVSGALDPADLPRMADALRVELDRRFPGAAWRREWPIAARIDDRGHPRLLRGEVDLFLDLPAGFVLVDHKSFPGDEAARDERVRGFAEQLAWYARALRTSLGKPLLAAFVHLPVRGELVEVNLTELLEKLG